MRLLIIANVEQQEEIVSKNTSPDAELVFVKSFPEFRQDDKFDAVLYLSENHVDMDMERFAGKPVIINSVIETLEQNKWPLNVSSINGWPGFLQRDTWEVASNNKA